MSVTGEGEQQKARPATHAPEDERRRGDGTDIARLVMDAARLANRARSGVPLDPEEVRQFSSSALPVVSLGLAEAGRFARKHKPTPAQRQAAKAATSRVAVAGKNRVAALLAGARAAASDAESSQPSTRRAQPSFRRPPRMGRCRREHGCTGD